MIDRVAEIVFVVMLLILFSLCFPVSCRHPDPDRVGMSEADIWMDEHADIIERGMKIVKPAPTPIPGTERL